eukprot:CAMPEP_0195300032 /NCGR_PEP_ID=MMETSP0707-20130614/26626_1 /TAXON_ID=33640 /ORGANISM="Asterionellopsis glacialis, Strain CCMP134" /LENGTH=186 /DNA_ID=CAMNT_0040362599 /DNA_START=259 /DNA_END=819 /DNA_ORIENTATION=-
MFGSSTNKTQRSLSSSSNDSSLQNDGSHIKSYSITGTGEKSSVRMKANTGHELQTDVPEKMGGGDTAPQPVEMLLGAFLGCTQATAIFVGRQMSPRLLIEKIEYDVSANRDERGALMLPIEKAPDIPARLQIISGKILVFARGGEKITEEQMQILAEQTEQRCPVANMIIASGCKINVEWLDGSST